MKAPASICIMMTRAAALSSHVSRWWTDFSAGKGVSIKHYPLDPAEMHDVTKHKKI